MSFNSVLMVKKEEPGKAKDSGAKKPAPAKKK